MPKCRSCSHPQRAAIDRLLVGQASIRDVAGRFSLKNASVHRHAARHLPEHLSRARDAEASSDAADLLAEIRALIEDEREDEAVGLECRTRAMAPGGHVRFATRAIEVRGQCRARRIRALSLLGELRGALERRPPDPAAVAPFADEAIIEAMTPAERWEFVERMRAVKDHVAAVSERHRPGMNGEGDTP